MENKMKIIWTCNGKKYDEYIVPADEVAETIGMLIIGFWSSFGQDGDKIEVVEIDQEVNYEQKSILQEYSMQTSLRTK